ncbi:MAG: ABC transporter substrate-binding protein [Rhodospirillaceae bacterium]|nr:ABC transporter substrate-binding protein [Rhodospirillaceae bacterium]
MNPKHLAGALVGAWALGAMPAQAAELRIGYLTTFTGGGAFLGNQQANGWKLGLEHEGWTKDGDKLGGVPTKMFYGDDKQDTDTGLDAARKMLNSDKVHILAGIVWSNVLMAVKGPVIDAKRILISTNAGASPMAGRQCSPYFISTSWNNDQQGESSGALVQKEGLKSVFLLAPNYQAGKDMLAGFRRYYKGKVIDQLLFKLGATDFQAEISRLRAAKPAGVFIFAPGAMGIAFMKQWDASGVGKEIKLFTLAVVDNVSLKPLGNTADGTFHAMWWDPNGKFPANEKFVKGYIAKFGHHPSYFAAQSYEAPRLLAAALRKMGGTFDENNMLALAKAMRHTPFDSVRGPYKYNVNGIPIQDWYKLEVLKDAAGASTIKATSIVFKAHLDSYWKQCPEKQRL